MGTINYRAKRRPKKLSEYIQLGNSKLPYSTAIFNMSSAIDCKSLQLGLCQIPVSKTGKTQCYAIKIERLFKTSYNYHVSQGRYWAETTAEKFVLDFKLAMDKKKKMLSDHPITALRFNEAGDFISQADVDKAEEVAKLLSDLNIRVYVYTARRDLSYTNCRHMVINFSTELPSEYLLPVQGKYGCYKAFKDVNSRPDNFGVCPCGIDEDKDCSNCRRCQLGVNSAVALH